MYAWEYEIMKLNQKYGHRNETVNFDFFFFLSSISPYYFLFLFFVERRA